MNRRQFLANAGALASLLIASACGAPKDTGSPVTLVKDKPTLLYFWTPN